MALQYSGQISMGQINVELGRAYTTANTSLDAAENGSYGAINQNSTLRPSGANPARMSEWYGYNHSAAPAAPAQFNMSVQFTSNFFSLDSNGFASWDQSGFGSNSNFYNFYGYQDYSENYSIYVGDTVTLNGQCSNPFGYGMEVYIEVLGAGVTASNFNFGFASANLNFTMPANNITSYVYLYDS